MLAGILIGGTSDKHPGLKSFACLTESLASNGNGFSKRRSSVGGFA